LIDIDGEGIDIVVGFLTARGWGAKAPSIS